MIHPAVRDLFLDLARHPVFQETQRRLLSGGNSSISGLTTTAKAAYAVLLWQATGRPLIIVVDGNKEAEALSELIDTFFNLLATEDQGSPQLLPALDTLPLQNLSPHAEILEERAVGLWRLATQRAPITILPVAAALLRIEPPEFYRQLAVRLKIGEEVPLDEVVAHLESVGYERREPVEMMGEYSVRGGILDVFSPESQKPVRIDLFGDLVESIRRFDVESQRSVLKVEDCILLPLTEYPRSNALLVQLHELVRESGIAGRDLPPPGEPFAGWEAISSMVRPRNTSILGLLDRTNLKPIVVWDEPDLVRGAAERLWKRLEQIEPAPAYNADRIYFRWEEIARLAAASPQLSIKELEIGWTPIARTEGGRTHVAVDDIAGPPWTSVRDIEPGTFRLRASRIPACRRGLLQRSWKPPLSHAPKRLFPTLTSKMRALSIPPRSPSHPPKRAARPATPDP